MDPDNNKEPELEYLTRKGGVVLLYNGYQFYRNKTYSSGSILWVCSKKKAEEKCRGTITIHHDYQKNRDVAKATVEALQDPNFDSELTFDLKQDNQVHLNRTLSLLIKYIVKREVDSYRTRRADAISRKVYSSLVMKLIDIAKDIPSNLSASRRIDTAHRFYMSVESRDAHDDIADKQVQHAVARLYDVLLTAPKILSHLGKLDDLTPRILVRKLKSIEVKPVHLAALLLIQYHLRQTVNYAAREKVVDTLSTKPQLVGPQVISTLKELAARLLPVAELLDVHLAHSSPVFKDTCAATWLGIVNNK